jgi:protein gp37
MSDKTGIEWTDATWNPIRGCSRVSEGCKNCYAERVANRYSGPGLPYDGTITDGRWNGQIKLVPEVLDKPLRWRKPRRIFVNSMSDLFHENVPLEYIAQVFDVMASATADCGKNHKHEEECWCGDPHIFQILTKRPERMRRVINEELPEFVAELMWGDSTLSMAIGDHWPLPNVWLGVSVENQRTADERIPLLLQTPAAVRFLSIEPMIGPVNLDGIWGYPGSADGAQLDNWPIHWVIVGGESGPGARPMHPDWVRGLRDQCQAAGVPFFFKQWGEWAAISQPVDVYHASCGFQTLGPGQGCKRVGKKAAGRILDGRTWDEFPSSSLAHKPEASRVL